jgi:hypothetical protein
MCTMHSEAAAVNSMAKSLSLTPSRLFWQTWGWPCASTIPKLRATRSRRPHFNNWLLFGGMIEAGLHFMGAPDWDPMRVDYALRQHEQWYKGDGLYGDGPELHCDYYNSLVIQPMLLDVLRQVGREYADWAAMAPAAARRATRHAEVLERSISETGTFPPLGRSLAYRCGGMQTLAQAALERALPASVAPAQVRCALGAVLRRSLGAPGTYDAAGWLRIGFAGAQPEVGEMYISTGSLYLASAVFLPLGLPPDDAFWAAPDVAWSQQRIWAGGACPIDHALDHEVI